MNAYEVAQKALREFTALGKTPADGITGLIKTEEGWTVLLEAVERKAIPDAQDVLGLYELRLDDKGTLLGFDRKKLRKRSDTKEE